MYLSRVNFPIAPIPSEKLPIISIKTGPIVSPPTIRISRAVRGTWRFVWLSTARPPLRVQDAAPLWIDMETHAVTLPKWNVELYLSQYRGIANGKLYFMGFAGKQHAVYFGLIDIFSQPRISLQHSKRLRPGVNRNRSAGFQTCRGA